MLDNSTEIFKNIKGYERYSVSNKGNVVNNITGNILSLRKASNGYLRVNLRKGNVKYEKAHCMSVHRLVANAFLPAIDGKTFVNHIDCDKTNNNVSNLEWCTAKENSIHAYNNISGLKEIYLNNLNISHMNSGIKIDVFKGKSLVGHFKSKRAAAKYLGISEKSIYNYLNNRTSNTSGYVFVVNGGDASANIE